MRKKFIWRDIIISLLILFGVAFAVLTQNPN